MSRLYVIEDSIFLRTGHWENVHGSGMLLERNTDHHRDFYIKKSYDTRCIVLTQVDEMSIFRDRRDAIRRAISEI